MPGVARRSWGKMGGRRSRIVAVLGLLALGACVRDRMNEAVHPLPPEAGARSLPEPVAGTGRAPAPPAAAPKPSSAPGGQAAAAPQPIPGIAPGADPKARLPDMQGGSGTENAPAASPGSAPRPGGLGSSQGAAGGLNWKVPSAWGVGPDRPMRAATYLIPAAAGDSEAAECAVFYFGSGQGGDIQANLDRWIGQFEQPDGKPSKERASVERAAVGRYTVTRIRLTGTYGASMGGFAPAGAPRKGYALLGAIVEGPDAPVFFQADGSRRHRGRRCGRV